MQLVWEGVAAHRMTQSRADNVGPVIDQAMRKCLRGFSTRKN